MLSQLASFSLILERRPNSISISRPLLAALVGNLPASCQSLEIDTNGADFGCKRSGLPPNHLCSAIRKILPQLSHIRLRLSVMCSSLFEKFVSPEEIVSEKGRKGDDQVFRQLQTLVIHCTWGLVSGCPSRICSRTDWIFDDKQPPAFSGKAYKSLCATLLRLYTREICAFPTAQHLLVSDEWWLTRSNLEARRASIIFHNIISQQTRQVPWEMLGDANCRMPSGPTQYLGWIFAARISSYPTRDIVGSIQAIYEVAEGELWVMLKNGTRLPKAGTVHSEHKGEVVRTRFTTKEAWRKEFRTSIQLWDWEEDSGVECLSHDLVQDGILIPVISLLYW